MKQALLDVETKGNDEAEEEEAKKQKLRKKKNAKKSVRISEPDKMKKRSFSSKKRRDEFLESFYGSDGEEEHKMPEMKPIKEKKVKKKGFFANLIPFACTDGNNAED